MHFGLICPLCCYIWMVPFVALGFNIDTRNHVILSGPPGSYYGYAVALIKNKWVLVGAPRDNDTGMPAVVEPGAIHRCRVVNTGPFPCEAMHIDNSSGADNAKFNGAARYFTHGKSHAWLGGSIETPNEEYGRGIVVCAHKWYNRFFKDRYLMNGFCYEIPLDLTTANIRKMPAMVNSSMQTSHPSWGVKTHNYAMASMGMAVHYTNTDTYLLLGAPGIQDWTGGFLVVGQTTSTGVKYSRADVENVNATQSQLLAYSASSGRYFADGYMYFAFGVPRADLIGKVVLYREDKHQYVVGEEDLEVTATEPDGTALPMNAYFGGSLYSGDVNNDGHDDLLVGAPLYSPGPPTGPMGGGNDEGRVYVYLGTNSPTVGFPTTPQLIGGREMPYARFGSAIMGLGDINRDYYNDVAVGAPYEDDMRGAVYIYNGYTGGLWPTPSQRISAGTDISPSLRGFGVALSKPADMNRDGINDVAVGAYLSDNAVLLYAQPVIQVQTQLTVTDWSQAQVAIIDPHLTNLTLTMCFLFVDRICDRLDLRVAFTLDETKVTSTRLHFANSSPRIDTSVRIYRASRTCTDQRTGTAVINSRNDLVTPVLLVAEYTIEDTGCSGRSATINRFNGSSPNDPLLRIQKELQFRKECPDNKCLTDLHMAAGTLYSGPGRHFIVGEPALDIDVTITKDGHPAYGSVFEMMFPKILLYKKVMTVYGDTEVGCSLEAIKVSQDKEDISDDATLVCEIGNPLYNDSGTEFIIKMAVPYKVTSPQLEMNFSVTTQSEEMDTSDNSMKLNIDLHHHVNLTFSGFSEPDNIFISDGRVNYSTEHTFVLENQGPSPLPTATVQIYYPEMLDNGEALFYLSKTKVTCGKPCKATCSLAQSVTSPMVESWINGRLIPMMSYEKPTVATDDLETQKTMAYMDCTSGGCGSVYTCHLWDLTPSQTATVVMAFIIRKAIVQHSMSDRKSMKITSHAFVRLNGSSIISNNMEFDTAVTTELYHIVTAKKEVSWWIIVVSIVGGILLIAILVALLYRIGFFKRQTMEEMARQQKETEDKKEEEMGKEKDHTEETADEHELRSRSGSEDKIIDAEVKPAKD